MSDIELVFCRDRGQVDVIAEQLERILRVEIESERRRAIVVALLAACREELAGAARRWTPAYDALLRDLLAAADALDAATLSLPWDEYGYFATERDAVVALHRRCMRLVRALDRIADAKGPLLSDAWAACVNRADAIALLELAVSPSEVRERLRRALIDHLAEACTCAPIAAATCLRAARAASLGTGDWALVEPVRAGWQTFVHGARCHAIGVACHPDASLAELAIAAEMMSFSELVERMGNPFVPMASLALSCCP